MRLQKNSRSAALPTFFTTTEVVKYSLSLSNIVSLLTSSCPNEPIHSTDCWLSDVVIVILFGFTGALPPNPSAIKFALDPSLVM